MSEPVFEQYLQVFLAKMTLADTDADTEAGYDDVGATNSDDERGIFILVKIISIQELASKIHLPITH